MNTRTSLLLLVALTALPSVPALHAQTGVGDFESHGDVGDTPKKGDVVYDAASHEYRVTGGGANIWANADAFQFVWKKVSGNVAITADVKFIGAGAVAHRKAVLMVRQNLNADSAYADIAVHGDGLTSLQYRPTAGAATLEARSNLTGPTHLRLERRGNAFTATVGDGGAPVGHVTVELQ